MHIVSKETKSVQTVKLTLDHRAETLLARYTEGRSIEMNQTARISLQILSMSNSTGSKDPRDKINTKRQNLPGATCVKYLRFSSLTPRNSQNHLPSQPPVWRPVVHLSAAGEALFTDNIPNPQPQTIKKIKIKQKI